MCRLATAAFHAELNGGKKENRPRLCSPSIKPQAANMSRPHTAFQSKHLPVMACQRRAVLVALFVHVAVEGEFRFENNTLSPRQNC